MSNLTLGKKIAVGFGLLIAISAVLGGLGSWQMKNAKEGSELLAFEYVPEMQVSADVRGAANRLMYAMRGYGLSEEEQYYQNALVEVEAMEKGLEGSRELAKKAEHLQKLPVQLEAITKEFDQYDQLIQETKQAIASLNEGRVGLDRNAATYMKEANAYLISQNQKIAQEIAEGQPAEKLADRVEKITMINDIIDLGNDTRIKAFKSQALRDPAIIEDAQRNFPKIEAKLAEILKVTKQEANVKQLEAIAASADGYGTSMAFFLDHWKELQAIGKQRTEVGNNVIESCKVLQDAATETTVALSTEAAHDLATAATVTVVGLIVAIVVGVLLAIFLIRSITGPINRVIAGMQAGAEQVASASGQVSSASQQLAEGASEQASSLEETSASLEMMASGAKEASAKGERANTRSQAVKAGAERGQSAMKGLNSAMEKIKNSSDETAKIIKTIDEIAFQTNLLALNAAVEAARAGDAGKGFAVVAEEVRNLAQRSAEAAKGTADLIDGAKQNSDLGVQATNEVSEILEEVVAGIIEVSDLINDVSTTVEEQARSVVEVNTAVSQMDSVTQANAASAEESASAAEEMSAQAGEMNSLVQDLVQIVGSASKNSAPRGGYGSGGGASPKKSFRPVARKAAPAARSGGFRPAAQKAKSRPMDEVIPLDDDCLIEI